MFQKKRVPLHIFCQLNFDQVCSLSPSLPGVFSTSPDILRCKLLPERRLNRLRFEADEDHDINVEDHDINEVDNNINDEDDDINYEDGDINGEDHDINDVYR